jgi:predicted transcriptional regulator
VQEKPLKKDHAMACINPDGTLTPTAQAVISTLKTSRSAVDIGQVTNLPVYRIRSTIRELIEAGLVLEMDGNYQLTESGMKRL